MKKLCGLVLAGLILLGASLPARCETDSDAIRLKQKECLKGTFQGFHMGQILMQTEKGETVELPSMALFWGTEPRIHVSQLQVGQSLIVTLPRHQVLRYLAKGDPVILGDYEGVSRIPQPIVGAWQADNIATAER
jgi:hypothetical protein